MSVQDEVLRELETHRGACISGEALAGRLSVSRNAVWKAVRALREAGYPIDAQPGAGYALSPGCHILSTHSVARYLRAPGVRLQVEGEVDSTNACLRRAADAGEPEGLVLLASAQTAGRGRRGRRFYSPAGSGLYMSLLLRPESAAHQAVFLTVMAAVAAARAAEQVSGGSLQIKWVNDLWKKGRKVCGILTEASLDVESGLLEYAIVGPGFNLIPPAEGWPPELDGIAGSLFMSSAPPGARARLAAAFLNEFWPLYRSGRRRDYLPDYLSRQVLPGRHVEVRPGGAPPYGATVLGVDQDCHLLVRPDGRRTTLALNSGEVQIVPGPPTTYQK